VSVTQSFDVPVVCQGAAPNTAPLVSISAPANNSPFTAGQPITFTGSAEDDFDENLSVQLAWSSSINGAIGSGASFTTSTLSVGTHTVTASVTDSGGLTGAASVSITVNTQTSDPGSAIALTANGYKIKGVQHADLVWSGATSTHVDIFKNNVKVTTTANDGAHTDVGGKGGGSYTYKVCNAGSTSCSPEVIVAF
jgi:hypothetical protein